MSQIDPFGSPGQPDQLSPEWLDLLYSVCPTLPEYDSGPEGKPETVLPIPANDLFWDTAAVLGIALPIPADHPFWDKAVALGYDRPDAEPVFYPPVSDMLMNSFLDSVFGPPSADP